MPGRLTFNSRARLAVALVLVAGILLAVLGWFGRRSLVQERDLTRLVLAERLAQTATLISREVDAEFARWEVLASIGGQSGALPSGATLVRFNAAAVIEVHGERLPYYPAVPAVDLPDDARLQVARRAETDRDLTLAVATYQDAATSTVRTVKATALAGLGRCLRTLKRPAEALAAYEDLARAADAQVAGVPAVFISRRERRAIYTEMGDTASADRERASLAQALRAAAHLVDRATFDAFAPALTADEIPKPLLARAASVVEFWPRWQKAPSGRIVSGAGPNAVAAVWRSGSAASTAIVAPIETVLAASLATAERLSVSIALEGIGGETVWGDASRDEGSVTLSLGDIGLPATMRVSLQGEMPGTDKREILSIAAFVLLALVIAIAVYVVFRSVSHA